MKKTGSLIGMSLVFIAGVLTGIGISAWKLDLGATGVHQAQKGQENSPKEEIKGRISEIERITGVQPQQFTGVNSIGQRLF